MFVSTPFPCLFAAPCNDDDAISVCEVFLLYLLAAAVMSNMTNRERKHSVLPSPLFTKTGLNWW